jgi:hypothetical protein
VIDSTTVAGGMIAVSMYGTFSFSTNPSTNYVLHVNGDVRVDGWVLSFQLGAAVVEGALAISWLIAAVFPAPRPEAEASRQ